MNEQEWISSSDPAAMLAHVIDKVNPRRLRLFAVACCRAVWDGQQCSNCDGPPEHCRSGFCSTTYRMGGCECGCEKCTAAMSEPCDSCHGSGRVGGLTDLRSRRAVEVSERYADEGEVVAKEMGRAWLYMDMEAPHEPAWILPYLACSPPDTLARDLMAHADAVVKLVPPATQASFLREIVGNPWRPVPGFQCSKYQGGAWYETADWLTWNNATVPRIAEAIYNERRWEDLPILADALEEAGCADEDILAHCRGLERCPKCLGGGKEGFTHRHGKHGPGYYKCSECNGEDELAKDWTPGWIPLRGQHVRGCAILDLLTGRE